MDSQNGRLGGRVETAESDALADSERGAVSVFDLVAPIAPCYRRGAVIQAMATTGRVREPIVRDAFEARELGLQLVEQASAIDEAVANVIDASGKALGLPISSLFLMEGPVKSRFAPGLILDFPSHEFRLGTLRVRERTCVTVCYNQAASKVWTRFIGRREGSAKISKPLLADFYRYCDEASRGAIEAIRSIYFDNFKAQLGTDAVMFEDLGEIEFIGFDTDCLEFDELIYSDGVGIVADATEISPERRDVFVRFFREHIDDLFPGKFSSRDIRGVCHDKVSAFRSEFQYRALYHGMFRDKAVTFLVMSEPGRRVTKTPYRRESGALTIIAELAAKAMKRF